MFNLTAAQIQILWVAMSAEQTNQTQSSFEYTNQPDFIATAQHTNKLDNNKMDNNNFVYQSMFDFRTIIFGWSFC